MTQFDRLEPLGRDTTASIIANRIRARITDGSFPPGIALGEAELAKRLGVSRGPVREALQRLIQEGLLHGERHRGAFVIQLDERDVADIYLARSAIEPTAARILIERDDQAAFDHLETIVDEMEEIADAASWSRVADLDIAFHEALVSATRSKRLTRMFRTLIAETRLCLRGLESAYALRQEIVDEHRQLLEALRRRDEEEASLLFEQHFRHALEALQAARKLEATGESSASSGA